MTTGGSHRLLDSAGHPGLNGTGMLIDTDSKGDHE